MPRIDYLPEPGERAIFVSKTGTGKTTKMLKASEKFWGVNQIQVLATKEDEKFFALRDEGIPFVTSIMDLTKYDSLKDYPMVIYQPRGLEMTPEVLDAWCSWIYLRKHTVAFIDEITQVARSTHAPPGFLDLYTRGRSQGDTVLAGSQRPRGIPAIVYSEAENIYKGRLNDIKDRKRVAEFSHPKMTQQVEDMWGVHYYNPAKSENLIYIKNF